ncbi:maleylpyruvate isomerase family mycothiol-dependent enzyme [Nocardioides sp. AN3]
MSHPTPTADLVRTASQRLVRTVDSLAPEAWARPSLLPGWQVAHVVAHVALNAEALAGVIVGSVERRPVTMYASLEARDEDIGRLADADPAELRDRLMASVTRFDAALTTLPDELGGTMIERTPGSVRRFPLGAVASMRLREVEIHHADLHQDYCPADWPEAFTRMLLDHESKHHAGTGFRVVATDLDGSWDFGTPGPTVTGLGHELAWWATGRAPYPGSDGPTSDDGVLPGIEAM